MTIFNWISFTGIWTQPIVATLLWKWIEYSNPRLGVQEDDLKLIFALSVIPMILIMLTNLPAYGRGKRDFRLLSFMSHNDPYYLGSRKEIAQYPDVPKDMLRKAPTGGIVLGRYKNRYVVKDINDDFHLFILGGSGSGKTSQILTTLLSNPGLTYFICGDPKGELASKSVQLDSDDVAVVDPTRRGTWGWDPLYLLDEDSTSQGVLETMQLIAQSLIPLSSGKDPFWQLSARNLLTGLLIHFWNDGEQDFISIMDRILSSPIKKIVEDIVQSDTGGIAIRYLANFSDMADETLSGVVAELSAHITVFATDADVRYCLSINPRRADPSLLEAKKSIYLVIPEHKLSSYYDLSQLVINQTLAHLERRPESAHKIVMLLDELPRLLSAGKMSRLLDAARTLRSRRVSLILISQSTEALETAYSAAEVADLLSNCVCKMVLSASSEKTQKTVCEWAGKYVEMKHGYTGGGMNQKSSVNFEDRNILEPADLVTLPESEELILISDRGYFRLKRTPYFKEKELADRSKEIQDYNHTIF